MGDSLIDGTSVPHSSRRTKCQRTLQVLASLAQEEHDSWCIWMHSPPAQFSTTGDAGNPHLSRQMGLRRMHHPQTGLLPACSPQACSLWPEVPEGQREADPPKGLCTSMLHHPCSPTTLAALCKWKEGTTSPGQAWVHSLWPRHRVAWVLSQVLCSKYLLLPTYTQFTFPFHEWQQ